MNASEKELLENILTADILILAKLEKFRQKADGILTDESTYGAIQEIKRHRAELVQSLLSGD
jgi:hypothetical protein